MSANDQRYRPGGAAASGVQSSEGTAGEDSMGLGRTPNFTRLYELLGQQIDGGYSDVTFSDPILTIEYEIQVKHRILVVIGVFLLGVGIVTIAALSEDGAFCCMSFLLMIFGPILTGVMLPSMVGAGYHKLQLSPQSLKLVSGSSYQKIEVEDVLPLSSLVDWRLNLGMYQDDLPKNVKLRVESSGIKFIDSYQRVFSFAVNGLLTGGNVFGTRQQTMSRDKEARWIYELVEEYLKQVGVKGNRVGLASGVANSSVPAAATTHPVGVAYPAERAYPAETGYAAEPAYPNEPAYADEQPKSEPLRADESEGEPDYKEPADDWTQGDEW